MGIQIPYSVKQFVQTIKENCGESHQDWSKNFETSFTNTLEKAIKVQSNHQVFMLTGDIPAMWLRDSTAQIRPYLFLAQTDQQISDLIAGLVKQQFKYINFDPYANAFNEQENCAGHQNDQTNFNSKKGWIWERKYEIDSLCYPVQLAYLLYQKTGRIDIFDEQFVEGVRKILTVFKTEQNHEHSPYRFQRVTDRNEDTLIRNGRGAKVAHTGMTWSGFRPSDDACQYGYLVPSNMFAVVILDELIFIFSQVLHDAQLMQAAQELKSSIQKGINQFAVTQNQQGDDIWSYDVDGLGNRAVMDDSNVPNLLAAPYLGYCEIDDPIYLNTRRTMLSFENPYYYEGKFAKGIGSSHTPENYVWPIALAMEGLTTDSQSEKERILNILVNTDAGTHLMHEGFDVNNPNHYTREWFSWANMMYCELLMDYFGYKI
ncbi:glycoside hydrolase family 125 protein [Lactococcus fujiensis]|uniref:Glycosyl hydrolase n=1 Tax=Lactococcus fujiensis JCM 16395 TaxID=1291764 RepID=A0A2A5RNU8_9LACT|nr:glycoside hydrolase family 125 protein [Lactococcus fujiensis]PCS01025.1 hypothetical protein RT41_GL000815 [Lactococcus fujiensis JCM 16395]